MELKDINYLDMIKSLSDADKQILYKSIILFTQLKLQR